MELKEKDYPFLIKKAKQLKIDFLSTPHGHLQSIDFLKKIKVPTFKIGSSDITDFSLLTAVAETGLPAILSTGQSTLKEISQAVEIFDKKKASLVLLHCVSNYPTKLTEANLAAIIDMYRYFPDKLIGYSDHTIKPESLITAVAYGACIIETHFTLDKKLPGPDQKASFEPQELKKAINSVRKTEKLIGKGFKKPTKSELKYVLDDRRSITSLIDINKGEVFSEKNLICRRPEKGGLPPKYWFKIIGKKTIVDIPANVQLKKGDWE